MENEKRCRSNPFLLSIDLSESDSSASAPLDTDLQHLRNRRKASAGRRSLLWSLLPSHIPPNTEQVVEKYRTLYLGSSAIVDLDAQRYH